MSLTSVCWEAAAAARSPAEDEPASPRDMRRRSEAQRISALPVNIIAKGRGRRTGGGRAEREKWKYGFAFAVQTTGGEADVLPSGRRLVTI